MSDGQHPRPERAAVTGQIRSLNPAIKVTAADSAANKDTAEVIEGMIRHREQVRCVQRL